MPATTMRATRNFLFPVQAGSVEDESLVQLSTEYAEQLDAALAQTRDKLAAIRTNPKLTPLGQQAEAADTVKRAAGELMGLYERAKLLERAIELKEGELLAPQVRRRLPPGLDPEDARAMERETRERLYGLKPRAELTLDEVVAGVQSREDVLEQAARSGDALTIRAAELAPPAFPVVGPDAIRAAAVLYAQHIDPAGYRTLEQQRSTLDMLQHNHNTAIRHFEEMAQTRLRPDPVAEIVGATPSSEE